MAVSAEVLREKVKELGEDAAKLLYLLYLYTGGSRSRWIKDYALWVLIYYGITKGVFEGYDYAPRVIMWHGAFRTANISEEAGRDLLRLRNMGLVKKLRLATSKYRYITAYRVSEKGEALVQGLSEKVKRPVEEVFKPSGRLIEIVLDREFKPLVKIYGQAPINVGFLDTEEVPYDSDPVFL